MGIKIFKIGHRLFVTRNANLGIAYGTIRAFHAAMGQQLIEAYFTEKVSEMISEFSGLSYEDFVQHPYFEGKDTTSFHLDEIVIPARKFLPPHFQISPTYFPSDMLEKSMVEDILGSSQGFIYRHGYHMDAQPDEFEFEALTFPTNPLVDYFTFINRHLGNVDKAKLRKNYPEIWGESTDNGPQAVARNVEEFLNGSFDKYDWANFVEKLQEEAVTIGKINENTALHLFSDPSVSPEDKARQVMNGEKFYMDHLWHFFALADEKSWKSWKEFCYITVY